MPWVLRGLRDGIVTSRYPRRHDGYGATFAAAVAVDRSAVGRLEERSGAPGVGDRPRELEEAAEACPTGAILLEDDRLAASVGGNRDRAGGARSSGGEGRGAAAGAGVRIDRGRCILCGRCVDTLPEVFSLEASIEVAAIGRRALVVPELAEDRPGLDALASSLAERVRAFGRSVHVRHVDCGSDGSEEWEIAALTNPLYDVQRLGIFFTASPRHADLLLVTGAGSAGMLGPLRATYEAMAEPRLVVAVGTDAASGGALAGSYATRGGVGEVVPVDVYVPGSPPSPFSILHGILLALGRVGAGPRRPAAPGAPGADR